MESIGKYLKELRESKNLSFEEISEQTRTSIDYLQIMENDEFEKFASIGYARATLYSYVRFLKGNEVNVINLFDNIYHVDNKKHYLDDSSGSRNFPKKYLLSTQTIGFFFLFILVIFLGGLTWHFAKSGLLKSPFKTIMKNEKKLEASENMKTKIALKDTLLKKTLAQEIAKKEITINEKSFLDTTDYVNQLIFNGEDSPLNYKKLN